MKTVVNNSQNKQSKIKASEKKLVERAAKKIVKHYGKTLKLLANE